MNHNVDFRSRLSLRDKTDCTTKNYVIGSAGGSIGSIMGSEELDRIVPQRRLKIQVHTWNTAMKSSKVTHESNKMKRIENFHRIRDRIDLPKPHLSSGYYMRGESLEKTFSYTIWTGDLNFRITKKKLQVENIINNLEKNLNSIEHLLNADELFACQVEDRAFQQYNEGRITFPPTFKFDPGCHSYDTSDKGRVPSYTDRILYSSRVKGTIKCIMYDSMRSVAYSDHKPVVGLFDILLVPGRDNVPMTAGAFNREVYLAGLNLRSLRFDIKKRPVNNKSVTSSACSIQ
ncbi:inositol polyphosphate 5-phosphatase [Cichlidogyrus casuarinus]|uniref:Inositol polyphosphate 5-phosphatase n=1 Tax=Cichlidogyrus casuarinus TaxID=1844966 RepID=A0ABD2QNV0_9PLAT